MDKEALGVQAQQSEEPRTYNIIIVDLNSKELPLKVRHLPQTYSDLVLVICSRNDIRTP